MPRRRSTSAPQLVATLEAAYGQPRVLPVFDPMEELVSCILSQHTSDRTSYPAFSELRRRYPSWSAVLALGPQALADVIRGAGLANQKAKSICGCLAAIRERNGGFTLEPLRHMPLLEARKWLTSLPGVGPKTASIVLGFSFGMGAIPIDTHVFRVCSRLGLLAEGVTEAKAHDLLLDMVPPELATRFHVALLAHGRAVCRAPRPHCHLCPLTEVCRWFRLSGSARKKAR